MSSKRAKTPTRPARRGLAEAWEGLKSDYDFGTYVLRNCGLTFFRGGFHRHQERTCEHTDL